MDVCEKHADKPITSWCRQHETVLCIECLLQDHKECISDVEEISVVKETVKEEAKILVGKFRTISEGRVCAFLYRYTCIFFIILIILQNLNITQSL